MNTSAHRNVTKKQMCPSCDHFHGVEQSNVPGATGLCLKEPPRPFIVGMAPSARSVIAGKDDQEMVPILRGFYAPVGPNETCSQWTPKPQGEA